MYKYMSKKCLSALNLFLLIPKNDENIDFITLFKIGCAESLNSVT